MSGGTPNSNLTTSPNFHNAAQVAGCSNLTATEELGCMHATALQQAVDAINPDPNRGLFRPIADNVVAFTNLTDRLEKCLIVELPFIGGFMFNEPAVFLPFDPDATTAPTPVPVPGVEGLTCSSKQEVDKRVAKGLPAYRYLYSADIPLVFSTYYQFRGNSTKFEWQTSFAM